MMSSSPPSLLILTIDLAHPPLPPERVEEALLESLSAVRNSDTLRALKIIHGYGSHGKGGVTKEVVKNWLYRQSDRVRTVIDGESYSLYTEEVLRLRQELGPFADPDLMTPNPGITVVWVK